MHLLPYRKSLNDWTKPWRNPKSISLLKSIPLPTPPLPSSSSLSSSTPTFASLYRSSPSTIPADSSPRRVKKKKRERERERERERALVAVNDFHYARAYSLVYIIYNTLREAHRWGTKRTARCVEGQWARKSGRKILLQSRLAARWRRIKLRPLLVIRLCNTRICKERCVARF